MHATSLFCEFTNWRQYDNHRLYSGDYDLLCRLWAYKWLSCNADLSCFSVCVFVMRFDLYCQLCPQNLTVKCVSTAVHRLLIVLVQLTPTTPQQFRSRWPFSSATAADMARVYGINWGLAMFQTTHSRLLHASVSGLCTMVSFNNVESSWAHAFCEWKPTWVA